MGLVIQVYDGSHLWRSYSPFLWERAGVREMIMAPMAYIFRGGVGAMIVSLYTDRMRP